MVQKGGTNTVFAEERLTLGTAKINPHPCSYSKLIWIQAAQVPWSNLAVLPVGSWIDDLYTSLLT